MRLGIIGGGRAAWAFGSTWRRIGWPLSGIALRSDRPITSLLETPRRSIEELARDSELLLIAVTDRTIGEVAQQVPETRAIIWHPSGSLPALRGGFSLHPLKALPAVGEPSDLRDTLLVFEGSHRDIAQRIASAAGARFAEITADQKPLYHAAAVFASNYVAALVEIANELIGIDNARDDLVALARSALENWARHDDARRFTGPAARGDAEVIAGHIELLKAQPRLALLYAVLAEHIVAATK